MNTHTIGLMGNVDERFAKNMKKFYDSALKQEEPEKQEPEKYTITEHGLSQLPNLFPTAKTITRNDFTGRNDPCPCGSGKKYKKCCMKG